MKLLGKIYSAIQSHIVIAFSVLLIVSFVLVFLVFNFSMNRYVASGATYELRAMRVGFDGTGTLHESFVMRVFRGNHRFERASMFEIDYNFRPVGSFADPVTVFAVADTLAVSHYVLSFTDSRRMTVENRTFYISIVPLDVGARIFMLEVTDILAVISAINRILLVSVVVVWLFSMLVAGILADSLMHPLRLLRDFVRQIGRGDFTPNTHNFVNDEFNDLNRSLNSAVRQLAAYDNEQKAFFQNVSHELRTPLTVIKMYGEGIQSGVMDPKEAAATILEAETRLAGMVDEILYVSRLDSVSAPPMEEINLRIMVEECIRRQRPVAEGRGIDLHYNPGVAPVSASCSMKHFERAVDNLISNAIRYAKTSVNVECYTSSTSAAVRVSDDGPGFEPDALPYVFERFYRGKGGLSGIGLSTVKSVIDMHKGSASAGNGENGGAVLTISIPRKKG